MKKVYILTEGQTEETFVRDVLAPRLQAVDIYVTSVLACTKRLVSGLKYKGGIISYEQVRKDILNLLGDSSVDKITTMIDFYGLPTNFPGYNNMPSGNCYQKIKYIEEEFAKDISDQRFLPYIQLHEFEAILFVAPEETARQLQIAGSELAAIREQFESPEEINDNPETAPSKRIIAVARSYQKPLHGPLVAKEIGIDRIKEECQHFREWLAKLEGI